MNALGDLADELHALCEDAGPLAFAKTQEMPVHPGVGAPTAPGGGGSRCPKGMRKHPDTGKCWPREQLKHLMRGHEAVAALHREKHLHHAHQAQALAASDPVAAKKHAAKAAQFLQRAKDDHQKHLAIHKELYPQKHKRAAAGAPSPMAKGIHTPAGRGVQAMPQFHLGHTTRSAGGQAWGAGGSSTPGYHPFGPPPQAPPAATPPSPSGSSPSTPSPEPAKPSMLHALGKSALQGVAHTAAQRASQGSLGWSALAGMLQHLTGAHPQAPSSSPPAPPTVAHNPFEPTTVQTPKPKKKKPQGAAL